MPPDPGEMNETLASDIYTNSPTSDDIDQELMRKLIEQLGKVVLPCTGVTGTALNGLTMAVLMYIGLETSSLVYMFLISVADTIGILFDSVFCIGLRNWGLVDVMTLSDLSCKVMQWIHHVTSFAPNFILLLFTLDRFLAVFRPFLYRRKLRNNLWYPVKTSALAYIASGLFLAPNLFIYRLENGDCGFGAHLSTLQQKLYFHYSVSFLYCVLPASLLIAMNTSIVIRLKRNRRRRKARNQQVKPRSREYSITTGLLMVTVSFLLLTLAVVVLVYILDAHVSPRLDTEHGAEWVPIAFLIVCLADWIAIVNQSINFFLYILASRVFRAEFFNMLKSSRAHLCCGYPCSVRPTGPSNRRRLSSAGFP